MNNPIIKTLVEYKMNSVEIKEWSTFQQEINLKCELMEISLEYKALINEHIQTKMQYSCYRGFHIKYGYYEISEGDRGSQEITLMTKLKEEALWYYLKTIVKSIGLVIELDKRKEYLPLWHYDVLLTNLNKQGWLYDLRYDGRKYWFEFAIHKLNKIYSYDYLEEYVKECTKLMNYWFDDDHWFFDKLTMTFIENTHSKEHN